MTLGVSLLLVAAGAILVWGVTGEVQGIDVDAVGVILMVVGVIGFILSLIFWDTWGRGPVGRRVRYVGRRTRSPHDGRGSACCPPPRRRGGSRRVPPGAPPPP